MKLRLRAAALGLAIIIPVFAPAASADSGANTPAVRTIEVDGIGETRTSPDDSIASAGDSYTDGKGNGDAGQRGHPGRTRRGRRAGDGFSQLRD